MNKYTISFVLADSVKLEANSAKEAAEFAAAQLSELLSTKKQFKAYLDVTKEVPGTFFDPETNCYHSNSEFHGSHCKNVYLDV